MDLIQILTADDLKEKICSAEDEGSQVEVTSPIQDDFQLSQNKKSSLIRLNQILNWLINYLTAVVAPIASALSSPPVEVKKPMSIPLPRFNENGYGNKRPVYAKQDEQLRALN